MKRARFIPVSLAALTFALAPACFLGQDTVQPLTPTTEPTVQEPPKPTPAQTDPSAAALAPNPVATNVELKPVKAELVNRLDSKKARVGDSVVVKTDEKVTAADGTEIPKGSKLVGHVALVHPHSKDAQNSQLALLFDQAQLKNGQSVPIKSTIEAVSPAEGLANAGSPDAFAGVPAGPTGGAPGGGGAMSGSRTVGASTPAAAAPLPSPSATQSMGTTGQGNSTAAGRVVAGSGENAIRTTDIPNIYLASSADGPVSGTLFSANADVQLDGGTRMVLDIAPTASH